MKFEYMQVKVGMGESFGTSTNGLAVMWNGLNAAERYGEKNRVQYNVLAVII